MSNTTSTSHLELGQLVKECQYPAKKFKQIILLTVISSGMALVCWLPAIFEVNESLITRIGVSVLGLFVSTPMFVGICQLFHLSGVSLGLYDRGLIIRRRGREFRTTWDEIDSYIQENACRITKKDGEVIEFGMSIDGGDEVAREIQKQMSRRLLPQFKAVIQAGSKVQFQGLKPFGKSLPGRILNKFSYAFSGFTVDSQGITEIDSEKRISWEEVKDYGVGQATMGRMPVDVFFIEDDKTSFRTRLGLLGNALILLKLCAAMTGLNESST